MKKLQSKILELVGKIDKIKIQIGKLENKREYYQDMLADAEKN
ncbi:hypothetical protein OC709_02425 ['Planchonia careya' phytoplasma]|nr:hypothetical protein ['Planchonia careya' phytoplasma]